MRNDSERPPGFEEEDHHFYDLFAHLREEAVRVRDDFCDRVAHRIEHAGLDDVSPSPGGLIMSVLLQSLNLLSDAVGYGESQGDTAHPAEEADSDE